MMDLTGVRRHAWHWVRYALGLARSGADEMTGQSTRRWRSLHHPELQHYKIHKILQKFRIFLYFLF